MQYKKAIVLGCVAVLVLVGIFSVSSVARPSTQQDVIRLENRITQLEQRLFSIETSLRNLEQQTRLAGTTVRGVNPEDMARLHLEVQALRQRVADHECGLAKLDERTLAPNMREARRKSGASDPCRLNSETPLRLRDGRQ